MRVGFVGAGVEEHGEAIPAMPGQLMAEKKLCPYAAMACALS
jgi:hypothetical protein